MKWAGAHTGATWSAKHGGDARAPTIAALGRVICQQVKTSGDEIDELKLGHRSHSHQRCAAGRSDNGSFGDRSVDDALFAKVLIEAIGNFKRAAIDADIFADTEDGRVAFHL